MHYAKLENSDRLRRVLAFLRSRGSRGATTREIVQGANVLACNTVIDEIRANGFDIECVQEGQGLFRYTLREEAQMRLFG